jgi:hypothetical protein
MLGTSLGSFFWLSLAYIYFIKYTRKMNVDALFFCAVLAFMYGMNVVIQKTKCSSTNSAVFTATFLPWCLMFAPLLVCLSFFPEWKKPFSNTFGYLLARIANSTQALKDILVTDKPLQYVYDDPSLLINQFTPSTFDEMYVSLNVFKMDNSPETATKKEAFRSIVRMKDAVSEWIWYLLGGSVAISSSYTILMNAECTKSPDEYVQSHQIAMATEEPVQDPTVYTFSE